MARRLSDVVAALDVVVGPDPSDLRSLPRPEAPWLAVLDEPRPPRRIAWCPTLGYAEIDDEVLSICRRAVDTLASLGAEVIEVDTLFEKDPVDDWLTLTGAYSLRSLESVRGTPAWEEVDPILRLVVDGAAETPAVEMVRAEDACHLLNGRLIELFRSARLLVCPVTAAAPPPRSLEGRGSINGKEDFNWVRLTYPFNMTRSPAATVCAGMTSLGLPVGIQLIGPQHGDLVVLRSAAALEQALDLDPIAPFPAGSVR
jgi:aspartyl-tRNA(Asn)/glutamyl-tRNA(Gln) amidotransferase subunit A